MKCERMTNPNPKLYRKLLDRSKRSGGAIGLSSEEALAYWVAVLQRHAAESEFGTNSNPVSEAPRLMALGMSKSRKVFVQVNLFKDDPTKILDEKWSPIELWEE